MANVQGNVMDLLDMLQFGDPGQTHDVGDMTNVYKRRPNMNPGTDPRAQAMQKYMEMKGAQQPPNPGFRLPNPYAGPQRPNATMGPQPTDREDAVNQMAHAAEEDGLTDTNAYFPNASKDYNSDDIDAELDKEMDPDRVNELEQDRRKPSYVDNKGNPSPNEDYTDEDILQGVSNRINQADFSGDPEKDKKMLIDDPSEDNINAFVKIHGKENLPDDLQEPDGDDPADNR